MIYLNKPVQNIVDLCAHESLIKSRDALVKSYEQHLKAVNDLRNALKKVMTEAVATDDFEAFAAYLILLEKAKIYAEQFEGLPELKMTKKSKKTEE